MAPLQGMEIGKLKNRIDEYDKFQRESREKYVHNDNDDVRDNE